MKISSDIQAIAKSASPLLIAIILFIGVGKFGISQISNIRSQIKSEQAENNTLSEKVSLLQSVTATAADSSTAAAVALPDSNSSLLVLSQLKNLAIMNSLLLTNIKSASGAQGVSGLSGISASFELNGTRSQIATYLQEVAKLAPIMIVTGIKLSEGGGTTQAGITLVSYWADLPKTLPATTEPIAGLNEAERNLLVEVAALNQPTFAVIPPSQAGGKPNPFSP